MRIRDCHGGAYRVDMEIVQKHITLNGKAISGTPFSMLVLPWRGRGIERTGKTLQKESPGSAGRV